jgi:peptidoglycan DL-endopeptidase CwlO
LQELLLAWRAVRLRALFAAPVAGVAALVLSVAPASADPSAIKAKEAQVQDVLNQIQNLDSNLEQAIEAYDAATQKLQGIEEDLRVNTRELHIARVNLKRSQRALQRRLVSVYTSEDAPSTLGILLGAGSMDQMLSQIDSVDRVENQDLRINRQVLQFKADVKQHRAELKNAEAEAQQLVQQRADAKASIESQLADRRQLVSSIRSEIVQMKAEERRRQAELARQAAAARVAERQQAQQAALGNPYATSRTPAVNVPPSSVGSSVVAIAERYLGVPYVYAGASPSGFDCSGLVMYVFAQVGISLPHYAASQYGYGMPVSKDQLQPGDLVFFDGLGHVGIYIGGGNFIHAPHTGDVVKISSLSESWYTDNYVGARRISG